MQKDRLMIFITNQEYNGLVANICRDIAIDGWKPDYIVGVGRGGSVAGILISHYFNINHFTLNISLSQTPPLFDSNCWMADDAFGINGTQKKILLVDDINDKGSTLSWIVNDWKASCMPDDKKWENVWGESVRFATVIDNLSSKFQYKINYTGKSINKEENNEWIVFPYENWWNN